MSTENEIIGIQQILCGGDNMPPTDEMLNRNPLLLKPNERFPTYQFYATMTGKASPEQTLLTGILTTFSWLRERFRELEVPADLQLPSASKVATVGLECLHSFRIAVGYTVEVVWIAEKGVWAMQLSEPDLGDGHQAGRTPVAGRIFETNIAFRLTHDKVEMGFRTLVSQPLGTMEPCEVYRPAVIKELVRNSGLKFFSEWPIVESCWSVSKGEVHKLMLWLKNKKRNLPAVVTRMTNPRMTTMNRETVLKIAQMPEMIAIQRPGSLHINLPFVDPNSSSKPVSTYPFCGLLDDVPRLRMGYAQFFLFAEDSAYETAHKLGLELAENEIRVYPVCKPDGLVTPHSFHITSKNQKQVKDELLKELQDAPKNHPNEFGDVVFLAEAKRLEQSRFMDLAKSKEELQLRWMEKWDERENGIENERASWRRQLVEWKEDLARLEEELAEARADAKRWEEEYLELERTSKWRNEEDQGLIDWLKAQRNWPNEVEEVAAWVERTQAGKLILHQKALSLLKSVELQDLDVFPLCLALEFLANEQRDWLLKKIDDVQLRLRCTRKYGRPFEVSTSSETTLKKYWDEYKIKYGKSEKGKSHEQALTYHLKVGTNSEKMIRIYYLWDAEKKIIVVGSLPKHLPTVSDPH